MIGKVPQPCTLSVLCLDAAERTSIFGNCRLSGTKKMRGVKTCKTNMYVDQMSVSHLCLHAVIRVCSLAANEQQRMMCAPCLDGRTSRLAPAHDSGKLSDTDRYIPINE